MTTAYRYLLIGGGMSADAAARGIRMVDAEGTIGLIGEETDPPYNRPPLSKGLWKPVRPTPFSRIWRGTANLGVDLYLGRKVVEIDRSHRFVRDDVGEEYHYDRLLLATGGTPIKPWAEHERLVYFRTLQDYHRLRALAESGSEFVVIGGGFIGSEIAAALIGLGKQVTMVFPESGIGARALPAEISTHLNDLFRERGTRVLDGRLVQAVVPDSDGATILLDNGESLRADAAAAGLGIRPNTALAVAAGLKVEDGIVVDESMRTTDPRIFAAGDAIRFYNADLEQWMRVEHEENANLTGQISGQGMAGSPQRYNTLPSVYSSLFGEHYDAVGELNPELDIVYDWIEPLRRGTAYYLRDGRVRGVLLWNVERGLDAAREIIHDPRRWIPAELKGRIKG
jgi:NAD(P)H-nitrite reductase large subunit